jgi:hypothetical protein
VGSTLTPCCFIGISDGPPVWNDDDDDSDDDSSDDEILSASPASPSKSASPSKYRAGYWLSSVDVLFLLQVLLGCLDVAAPTSHDLMLTALLEHAEGDPRCGTWVPVVINTASASSAGLHWLLSLVHFVAKGKEVVLWEPLATTELSAPVKDTYEEKGVDVTLVATGCQLDAWSCGYKCCFWNLLCVLALAQGDDPSKWSEPPPPPPAWTAIIWLLLTARDAQRCDDSEGVAALAEYGVTELFRTAVGSGELVFEDFQGLIGKYIADLAPPSPSPSLGLSSSSLPSSTQPPTLVMYASPSSHAGLYLCAVDDDDAVIVVDSPAEKDVVLATPKKTASPAEKDVALAPPEEDVVGAVKKDVVLATPKKTASPPKKAAAVGSSPMNYCKYALRVGNSSFKRGEQKRLLFEELWDKQSGDKAVLGDGIIVKRAEGKQFSCYFVGGSNVHGRTSNRYTAEILVQQGACSCAHVVRFSRILHSLSLSLSPSRRLSYHPLVVRRCRSLAYWAWTTLALSKAYH